jgi:hypothetical protein
MHPNQGPISVTFKHAPGDVVLTLLGNKGIIEVCRHDADGNHYTITAAAGGHAYLHEENVEIFTETQE